MSGPAKGARLDFRVTFERFTPESIANGDAEERGYIVEAGTLRDCIPAIAYGFSSPRNVAHGAADCSHGRPRWLDFGDYAEDITTGEQWSRALHIPEGITDASAERVARLLGVRGRA